MQCHYSIWYLCTVRVSEPCTHLIGNSCHRIFDFYERKKAFLFNIGFVEILVLIGQTEIRLSFLKKWGGGGRGIWSLVWFLNQSGLGSSHRVWLKGSFDGKVLVFCRQGLYHKCQKFVVEKELLDDSNFCGTQRHQCLPCFFFPCIFCSTLEETCEPCL